MSHPPQPGIVIQKEGRVLVFTLDRPDAGNEIDAGMFGAMREALRVAATDGTTVLRLRARGEAFCTGRERAGRDLAGIRREVARLIAFKRALRDSPLVSVAEVQGAAAGFGMGLAVLCDFTLVAAGVPLSFPEMRKGLPPAAIMAYLGRYALPKRVFPLVLLGGAFTPTQALEAGLVTSVCAPATLAVEADALVDRLLALDPEGVRECKRFFRAAQEAAVEDNFRHAAELLTVESLRLLAKG